MANDVIVTFWYWDGTFIEVFVANTEIAEKLVIDAKEALSSLAEKKYVSCTNINGATEVISLRDVKNIYHEESYEEGENA